MKVNFEYRARVGAGFKTGGRRGVSDCIVWRWGSDGGGGGVERRTVELDIQFFGGFWKWREVKFMLFFVRKFIDLCMERGFYVVLLKKLAFISVFLVKFDILANFIGSFTLLSSFFSLLSLKH